MFNVCQKLAMTCSLLAFPGVLAVTLSLVSDPLPLTTLLFSLSPPTLSSVYNDDPLFVAIVTTSFGVSYTAFPYNSF